MARIKPSKKHMAVTFSYSPLVVAWLWGVLGWALTNAQPPVLGACYQDPLPTGCGCGGCGRGDPSPTPTTRALACSLCALWGRHEGNRGRRLLLRCGASWVGRSPTPDRPSLGRATGARYPLAADARGLGVGTRHQPRSARSCELALHAVGAARGRPGGGASLAWVWGVFCWALTHARPPVLGACGRGPLPAGCGCGGCGRGDPSPTPQRALLRAGIARCGGGTRAARAAPVAWSWGVQGWALTHA